MADRHLVVVENHQQVLAHAAGVVHRLVDDARRKRSVANHGHGVPVALAAHQVVAAFKPQGGRNTRSGMAGHEQVVFALLRVGVAHQAPLGAHGAELVVAPRDELVRIDLVACVPDEAVAAEVERRVQRQAQFNHAQVRGKVGRAVRNQIAKDLAHFTGQLLKLGVGQVGQVARRFDLRE